MFGGRSNLPSVPNPFGARNPAPTGYNQAPPTPPRAPQQYNVPPPYGGGQQPQGRGPSGPSGARQFGIVKVPDETWVLQNIVAANPGDFKGENYCIIDGQYVVTTRPDPSIPPGKLGLGTPQRDWGQWSLTDTISVTKYEPFENGKQVYLGSLDVEIGFAMKKMSDEQYDQDDLTKILVRNFQNQMFAPGQRLIMDVRNIRLLIVIKTIQIVDLYAEKGGVEIPTSSNPHDRGILTPQTFITFYKNASSPIKLKGSSRRPAANSIIQPNFKFEDMGIGGLDTEFSAIFRRAFASRIFPPGLVEKLGIQHVKGILLFGPPGTGKTLIARQIGKMLNSREPKIVNGPEILNKFVGQSEENVRKLFADAEKEYKEKGDESGLHIIIFDELDAICKQRGSKNDGTGVGDSVVNQLLSKLDGVDQLNNILVIGMTNRMDMIDEALLRAGRLEVHMEISLPDEFGRRQILRIHTNKMKQNNVMDSDVNTDELASLTKNFSGAEIGGLVKSATSFAFNRHVKVGTVAGISDDIESIKVNRQDFMNALEEVHPIFGVSEEEFETCVQGGIIKYAPHIDGILKEGQLFASQVKLSEKTPLVSVLIHGPAGAGKTALAAQIAMNSEFPFIKLISPEGMVGFNEMAKVSHLNKVFMDAYKSSLSVIMIDNIERILDWVPIGPRFSNAVLQALMVLVRKQPPKGRRLLILATTSSRNLLSQLDILNSFDGDIGVPNVATHQELATILHQLGAYTDRTMSELAESTGTRSVGVGVKKIILAVETAKQDDDKEGRLASIMAKAVMENGGGQGGGGNYDGLT